jgi:hypothetical protein
MIQHSGYFGTIGHGKSFKKKKPGHHSVTGGLSHLQRYGPSGIPDMAACRFVNNSVLLLSRING